MGFIVDNYLWFLVFGILFVMALIGFIAEKTNFGKTSSNKDKLEKNQFQVKDNDDNLDDNAEKNQELKISDNISNGNTDFDVIDGLSNNTVTDIDSQDINQIVSDSPYQINEIDNNIQTNDFEKGTDNEKNEDMYAELDDFNSVPISDDKNIDFNGLDSDNVKPDGMDVNEDNIIPEIVKPTEFVDLENSAGENVIYPEEDKQIPNINPMENNEEIDEDIWKF